MVVCPPSWSVSVRSVPSLLTRGRPFSFFSMKEGKGEDDDDGPVSRCLPCVVFAQHWQPRNHGRRRIRGKIILA